MPEFTPRGCAFNRTRQVFLATTLALADTHWSRLRGLLGASPGDLGNGWGLWIVPCRGVHTLAMRFPIDVVYLDRDGIVVHIDENLKPWRFARVHMQAASVLELPRQVLAATGTVVGDKIEIKLEKCDKTSAR
jgi:uncharacterized membrane protein (UPF0127 family)